MSRSTKEPSIRQVTVPLPLNDTRWASGRAADIPALQVGSFDCSWLSSAPILLHKVTTLKTTVLLAALCSISLATPTLASDPQAYKHFEAKPAETLSQAVANFSEYNYKLQEILAGDSTDAKMHEVHELTYTLETALEKINEEMTRLADTLEELHQASEKMDAEAVSVYGHAYLSVAREVIK